MARTPLSVYLNGRSVGTLNKQASGAIDFEYEQSWLDWEGAVPVSMSMPLREDRYIGDPVVAVFDNLLPDNKTIRTKLAEKTKAGGSDVFSLLSAIGRDCVGALQFLPAGSPTPAIEKPSGKKLKESEIAERLRSLHTAPLGLREDSPFRISLAGAQEKIALLYWRKAWQEPRGVTATTHILKPQIGKQGEIDLSNSAENEYFCMNLIKKLGLPVAEVEILDFEDQRVLSVERFDRRVTKDRRLLRLPQEDMCQALSVNSELKYEIDGGPGPQDISNFLLASDKPERDRLLFLTANFVFWLLGATDGHAKNFSIALLPAGRFNMTPLYDVISTQPNVDYGNLKELEFQLSMAFGKNRHYKMKRLTYRHFLETAETCGISKKSFEVEIEQIISQMPTALETLRNELPKDFPDTISDSISHGITKRLASHRI